MNSDPVRPRPFRAYAALAVAAALAVGLALRLYTMGEHELAFDEAFTNYFVSLGWSQLWNDAPKYDVHPPLFYAATKMFAGDDLFHLRIAALLFGMATIVAGYFAGRLAAGRNANAAIVGVIVAILIAVAARQVGISQTARSYSLFVLAMAISLAGMFAIFRRAEAPVAGAQKALTKSDLFGAGVAAFGLALLMWTHNIGAAYVGVVGLAALASWAAFARRDLTLFWLIAAAGVGALVLWSPAISYLVNQLTSISKAYWITVPTAGEFVRMLFWNFGAPPTGGLAPMIAALIANIGLGLIAVFGLVSLWREGRKPVALLLAATIVGPILVLGAYSILSTPVLMLRVIYPTFIPWAIAIAFGVVAMKRPALQAGAGLYAVAVVASGLGAHYTDKDEWWSKIAEGVAAGSTRPAVVFTVPNSVSLAFSYYAGKTSQAPHIVPLPSPFPAVAEGYVYGGGVLGIPAVDEASLAAIDRAIADNPGADYWLIVRGHEIYDPEEKLRSGLEGRFCFVRTNDRSISYLRVFRLVPRAAGTAGTCPAPARAGTV